jgi:hypothetical protein
MSEVPWLQANEYLSNPGWCVLDARVFVTFTSSLSAEEEEHQQFRKIDGRFAESFCLKQ